MGASCFSPQLGREVPYACSPLLAFSHLPGWFEWCIEFSTGSLSPRWVTNLLRGKNNLPLSPLGHGTLPVEK